MQRPRGATHTRAPAGAAAVLLLGVGCGSGAVTAPDARDAARATSSSSTNARSESTRTDASSSRSAPTASQPGPTDLPTGTPSTSRAVALDTNRPAAKHEGSSSVRQASQEPRPNTPQNKQDRQTGAKQTPETKRPPAPKPSAPAEKPAVRYDWNLPTSDTSVTINDGPAYNALRSSCDEGAAYLSEAWSGFRSPRNVLLFAAGVELCRGDREGGSRYFEAARTTYGLDGLQPEGRAECDVYKSVRSVLEQQPRDAFPCPGGSSPPYRTGPGGEDNPLTFDVDESTPTMPPPSGAGADS